MDRKLYFLTSLAAVGVMSACSFLSAAPIAAERPTPSPEPTKLPADIPETDSQGLPIAVLSPQKAVSLIHSIPDSLYRTSVRVCFEQRTPDGDCTDASDIPLARFKTAITYFESGETVELITDTHGYAEDLVPKDKATIQWPDTDGETTTTVTHFKYDVPPRKIKMLNPERNLLIEACRENLGGGDSETSSDLVVSYSFRACEPDPKMPQPADA